MDAPNQAASSRKVFGAPLQNLYRSLLKLPSEEAKPPRQAQLIRDLTKNLADQGLQYHPRTVKRQLLGNIEYVPEFLEQALLTWVKTHAVFQPEKLLSTFEAEKASLAQSDNALLYVPPQFLTQMADGFLYLHKQLSRRQLAIKLSQSLQARNIHIGLETLQAALAGKTQKVRKILEETLIGYFLEEGFRDRQDIENFLQKIENHGTQEVKKVEIGELARWAEAYLSQHPATSKRQLALELMRRLAAKGYAYHLSSIQSVLEGKTHKTRQVILDTLKEFLQERGLNDTQAINDYVQAATEGDFSKGHYISAEAITSWVQQLLARYPSITRRRIALQLQEDLQKKNFHFSLSTLQYLLAGKTQRVKKIVDDLLRSYLEPEGASRFSLSGSSPSYRGGRQSLQKRILATHELYQKAEHDEKESLRESFLGVREELIKRLWVKRHLPKPSRSAETNPGSRALESYSSGESLGDGTLEEADIAVSYDVQENLHRLVS